MFVLSPFSQLTTYKPLRCDELNREHVQHCRFFYLNRFLLHCTCDFCFVLRLNCYSSVLIHCSFVRLMNKCVCVCVCGRFCEFKILCFFLRVFETVLFFVSFVWVCSLGWHGTTLSIVYFPPLRGAGSCSCMVFCVKVPRFASTITI